MKTFKQHIHEGRAKDAAKAVGKSIATVADDIRNSMVGAGVGAVGLGLPLDDPKKGAQIGAAAGVVTMARKIAANYKKIRAEKQAKEKEEVESKRPRPAKEWDQLKEGEEHKKAFSSILRMRRDKEEDKEEDANEDRKRKDEERSRKYKTAFKAIIRSKDSDSDDKD